MRREVVLWTENESEIWEKQPSETPKAYLAFTIYRDLPAHVRTLAKAFRVYMDDPNRKVVTTAFRKWYEEWKWVERTDAWDKECDRVRRVQNRNASEDMLKRHANIALLFQNKAVDRMQNINVDDIPIGVLPYWIKIAVDLERQARGEPDQVIHNKTEDITPDEKKKMLDLAELSDEQLMVMATIQKRIQDRLVNG